jgi:hypothetical protein
MLTAAVYTLLAVALLWYAWSSRLAPVHACTASKLIQIGDPAPQRVGERTAGPAALGLLTGLNLCPPFIAAGIRAAQSASMMQALAFFALFFLGTSVWFIPFTAIGCIARSKSLWQLARIHPSHPASRPLREVWAGHCCLPRPSFSGRC